MAYGFTYTLPTIAGSHTDFVVTLKTADFPSAAIDGGASSILNGGGNLRAYTSSAKTTQLPVHVVEFVAGGTPAADVRVKILSAATGNSIHIEADSVETSQPAVTNTYGRNAVYSNDDLVYGLKDSTDVTDYTGTDDAAIAGSGATTGTSPAFGSGNIDLNGTAYLNGITDPFAGASRAAVRSWYKIPNELSKGVCGAWLGDSNMSVLLFTGSNDLLYFRVNTAGTTATATSTSVVQDGTWHFVGGIYDGSTVKTVVDGALEGSASRSGTISTPSSAPFEIGRYNNNNSTLPADMQEVRLSTNANVTADYIATEYANQSATGAWGTVGTWADSGGGSTYAITGSVTVSATPTATLDYQHHPAISGDVTISAVPASATGFSSGHSIVGGVAVTISPAATLDHQQHPAITGSVSIAATPAATTGFSSGYTVVGDVTISTTPNALLAYSQHPSIVGDTAVSVTPASALDHQIHPAISGDVSISATPSATMVFASGEYIQGDVTITALPSGVMSFTRHAAIAGNVPVSFLPAAVLAYHPKKAISGSVAASVMPSASMIYTSASGAQFILGNPRVWTLPERSHTWKLSPRNYTWEIK